MDKTNGGFLISQIKQIQGRIFEKLLSDAAVEEFNGAQGRILYVLWQTDAVPIGDLVKKTGLAKNTLTSMLNRMEQSGMVCRSYDTIDRRQIIITLTSKAKELQAKYDEISDKMRDIFYDGFTDNEITIFEEYLGRVLSNLTK